MSSRQYLSFLGSVLDFMSEQDKNRMGEYWQGLEQVFASVYQKYLESHLNVAVNDILSYTTERWLPYTFDSTTQVLRSAIVTGTQDLSVGVRLNEKYLLKFSWDNNSPVELDLRGLNPIATTIDEIRTRINAFVGFQLTRGVFQNTILQFTSPTSGIGSSITFYETSDPSKNAIEFIMGILATNLPESFPQFPYNYTVPYEKVTDIPTLQDHIRDATEDDQVTTVSVSKVLTIDTDYILESNSIISFAVEPPATMWAKRTLIDEETPWKNFGFLMDIYESNSPAYLSVIQGLWFAFWNGPKPENIRRSLYLLFGLPVAQEDTVVTLVDNINRLVQTTSPDGRVRTFPIPLGLDAAVNQGDSITRFTPLVTGITVFDKINRPGFIADLIGRPGIQRFLLEEASRGEDPGTDESKLLTVLEENTFLPQIDVEAFVRSDINLSNVRTFLSSIQPLTKTFLFQIITGSFTDSVMFSELNTFGIGINVTPNVDANQTTWTDQNLQSYELNPNTSLDLDSDGALLMETAEIEVYQALVLIDSFIA